MGEWIPVDDWLRASGQTAKEAPVRPDERTVPDPHTQMRRVLRERELDRQLERAT